MTSGKRDRPVMAHVATSHVAKDVKTAVTTAMAEVMVVATDVARVAVAVAIVVNAALKVSESALMQRASRS